jgi:hypothetical protein
MKCINCGKEGDFQPVTTEERRQGVLKVIFAGNKGICPDCIFNLTGSRQIEERREIFLSQSGEGAVAYGY